MTTTDLKLQDVGSLPTPGPIGRLVRLGMGLPCLWLVADLWMSRNNLLTDDGGLSGLLINASVFGLILVSYVVNIGFSRDWKKWPAVISVLLLGCVALVGYVQTGAWVTPILASGIQIWLIYVFLHLGTAFCIAVTLATPGCEMRAFHHLYSKITGDPTKEHHCPIGPLRPIDEWEASRRAV